MPVMSDEAELFQPHQVGNEHYVCDVSVVNEMGLHARPASLVVGLTNKFECDVTVQNGDNRVDAKSILQLLSLSAEMGTRLKLETRGKEALAAITALAELVRSGFDDPPSESLAATP